MMLRIFPSIDLSQKAHLVLLFLFMECSQEALTADETQYEKVFLLVMVPFDGKVRFNNKITEIIVEMAKEKISREKQLDAKGIQYTLEVDIVNDFCDGSTAIKAVLDNFSDKMNKQQLSLADTGPHYVSCVVGMMCNNACRAIGSLYGSLWIPVVSIGCTADDLSGGASKGYATFSRVVGTSAAMVDVALQLILHYKWPVVAIVQIMDNDWLQFSRDLQAKLESKDENGNERGVEVVLSSTLISDERMDADEDLSDLDVCKDVTQIVADLREKAFVYFLPMYDSEVMAFVLAMRDAGLLGPGGDDYAFVSVGINPEFTSDLFQPKSAWPDRVKDIMEAQEGLISINPRKPKTWRNFVDDVDDFASRKSGIVGSLQKYLTIFSALLHDAILLWANSIRLVTSDKSLTGDIIKEEIYKKMPQVIFEGYSGTVTLNEGTNDRSIDYSIEIINYGVQVPMFDYLVDDKKLMSVRSEDVNWPGKGKTKPPVGKPPCGFIDDCTKKEAESEPLCNLACIGIITVAMFLLVVILLAVAIILFKKRQAAMRTRDAWILNWNDVLTFFPGTDFEPLPLKAHMLTREVRRQLEREVTRITFGMEEDLQEIEIDIGHDKGKVLAIKYFDLATIDRRNGHLLKDLTIMTTIRHENLQPFHGVCLEEPDVCILTYYAKNGSLHNVLEDKEMDLTPEFKFSFAMDIASGLEYIHSSALVFHGHLTSRNVVVDKMWTCKIIDYGMKLFHGQDYDMEDVVKQLEELLWKAPELLLQVNNPKKKLGTPKGDVYSYGIILQEIAMRDVPYAEERKKMDLIDLVRKLTKEAKAKKKFRPRIPKDVCSEKWLQLMTSCWAQEPEARPTSKQIVRSLRQLTKKKTSNIVDSMLEKLEKHTRELEKLVAERKEELSVEKKKVEQLLFNILPKSVADVLLTKGAIQPEYFQSVTIYFSDIVGFQKIAQASTAVQLISFLNAIFSTFDEITDKYDVQKCDTIGDVYFVGSGLPNRNEDRHVYEIATFSLHLLNAIMTFKIPHIPNKLVQLRIGIHTGPVVAGVVGLKLPIYCVIGDTVNTASRMLTSSIALHIHASQSSSEMLMMTGQFFLDKRGEREVKGKGKMTTYWVVKKRGFNLPRPDLSLAAPMEDHYFK